MHTGVTYRKNIPYLGADEALEIANSGLATDMVSVIIFASMHAYGVIGSQMVINRSVTDELHESDIGSTVHFADIPWPAQSLEMFFEDPALPTLLVTYMNVSDMEGIGIKTSAVSKRYSKDQRVIRICAFPSYPEGAGNVISYSPEDMDGFVHDRHTSVLQLQGGACLTESDESDMREFAILVFKVLAYCAVPRCTPKAGTRKDLKFGGKAGVKNRPERPILRVVSLPPHIHAEAHAKGSGSKRTFMGRRGHFHFYRHARFTNKRGTFDYFPAVKVGQTRTLFKVR